jgi:hypothetical protein
MTENVWPAGRSSTWQSGKKVCVKQNELKLSKSPRPVLKMAGHAAGARSIAPRLGKTFERNNASRSS